MEPNQSAPPTVVELKMSVEDFRAFAFAFGLTEPTIDRCSNLFLFELYTLHMLLGIEPGCIIEEVGALECGDRNRRGTKKADRFRHPELKSLWKKHYFTARYLPQNLLRAWESGSLDRIIMEELDPAKEPVGETHQDYATRLGRILARRSVEEPFLERQKRRELTGEWIVFAKHETGNHYLTIGRHGEGDSAIRDRIVRGVVPQFPFVAELLGVEAAG